MWPHEEFYRRYAAQAYGVIVRIVRERAVADELLQEVFWQVWRSAAQYRGGNGAAWLMQIARNRSLTKAAAPSSSCCKMRRTGSWKSWPAARSDA
ncbi:MAG: sigma factor [Caldilineaceae bacterium]